MKLHEIDPVLKDKWLALLRENVLRCGHPIPSLRKVLVGVPGHTFWAHRCGKCGDGAG